LLHHLARHSFPTRRSSDLLSCAILPQPSPLLCSATMSSKLLPDSFASRCAFSNPPHPSPVDALSACNVATGTPVSVEILSKFARSEEHTSELQSRGHLVCR